MSTAFVPTPQTSVAAEYAGRVYSEVRQVNGMWCYFDGEFWRRFRLQFAVQPLAAAVRLTSQSPRADSRPTSNNDTPPTR